MKNLFLALGVATVLTACGGGGSGSSNGAIASNSNGTTAPSSNGTTTSSSNGTTTSSSGGATTGSIADITSPTYAASLKAVAEVDTARQLLSSIHDLVVFGGQTGSCPGGGTLSFSASTGTETLTQCMRRYPQNGAYTGTYTGTGNASNKNISAINAVQVYSPSNTSQLLYTINSGSFTATDVDNSNGVETTALTSGSVVFNVGSSSTYDLNALNNQLTNNGSTLSLASVNTSNPAMQVAKAGGATYDVTLNQPLQIVGSDNFPSSGSINIAYSTTTGCTPIVLTYEAGDTFNMSCGGGNITKSWTDPDVVSALNAARQ